MTIPSLPGSKVAKFLLSRGAKRWNKDSKNAPGPGIYFKPVQILPTAPMFRGIFDRVIDTNENDTTNLT